MPITSFNGEHAQRIDGKGRTTIPSDFRRVLEANDPDWQDGLNPGMQLLYGENLGAKLEIWTVAAFREVDRTIRAIKPKTADEARAKATAEFYYQTCSCRLEVDRDGRTVIPPAQRERLGREGADVVFAGTGDRFAIWAADAYEREVRAPMRERLAALPPGADPLTAIYAMGL